MSLYEHVILARPDISPTQIEEMVNALTKKIHDMGGEVVGTEYWGLRNLAYRVKKNRKAHYCYLQLDAEAATLHELERQHRINEDILRYLSVKVDAFHERMSPILSKREERKRREKRGE